MFGINPGTDETWKWIPQDSVGIELGVWKGDSTEKFLRRAKYVHAVDAWAPEVYEQSKEFGDYEAYLDRYSKLVGSRNPEEFQKYYDRIYDGVVKRFKDKPVMVWRMNTNEFFEEWNSKENFEDAVMFDWIDDDSDLGVDWVYVDASHEYDQVLQDLYNSLRVLNSTGVIFGDDYGGSKVQVTQAVDDFVKDTGFKFENFYTNQYQITPFS